jgi:hypothetical protein
MKYDDFKIESGIKIPEAGLRYPGRPRIYPFDAMMVGDSIFVPGQGMRRTKGKPTGAAKSAYKYAKKSGKKFSARSTREGNVDGVRIWRVA